jgi:predicted transposase/invertase (TIGR01784 family)
MSEELEEVMEKGLRKGLRQGREEGRQEERQQTALSALKEGLSLQTVSKITNLPISELEKLKREL